MADISDVLTALETLITAAVYPAGTSSPSILGAAPDVKIYPGWPNAAQLDKDLAPTGRNSPPSGPCSALHVSIFPLPGMERNTTRYRPKQQAGALVSATYTLTASGQVITVGGAAPATYTPQNLAIFVNGKSYLTQATAAQTTASLAAVLGALIVAAVPGTTVSGSQITLPAGARIGALRVGTTAPTSAEVRRQQREVQITVWADNPANRDALAQPIDLMLAQATFITLPDGSRARLIYHGSPVTDAFQKQAIYRRDLRYSVEYPTIQSGTATEIVAGQVNLFDQFGNPEQTVNF